MASSATTWVKFATGAILSITVSWLVTACDATPTEENVSVAQEADHADVVAQILDIMASRTPSRFDHWNFQQ